MHQKWYYPRPLTHPLILVLTQIDYLHSKSVRVVLWATSMIDTDSSNYQQAHDNGYMIK